MNSEACVFCDILAGRAEGSLLYQDEYCAAFMDIAPINPGHILVIPKQHSAYLAGLSPEVWGRISTLGKELAGALRASDLRCEGVNLFLADGEAAGQEVFHVHLHVFPRFAGDGFRLQFPASRKQLPPRVELDDIAGKLRQLLAD